MSLDRIRGAASTWPVFGCSLPFTVVTPTFEIRGLMIRMVCPLASMLVTLTENGLSLQVEFQGFRKGTWLRQLTESRSSSSSTTPDGTWLTPARGHKRLISSPLATYFPGNS